jgi:hypothetical protein
VACQHVQHSRAQRASLTPLLIAGDVPAVGEDRQDAAGFVGVCHRAREAGSNVRNRATTARVRNAQRELALSAACAGRSARHRGTSRGRRAGAQAASSHRTESESCTVQSADSPPDYTIFLPTPSSRSTSTRRGASAAWTDICMGEGRAVSTASLVRTARHHVARVSGTSTPHIAHKRRVRTYQRILMLIRIGEDVGIASCLSALSLSSPVCYHTSQGGLSPPLFT